MAKKGVCHDNHGGNLGRTTKKQGRNTVTLRDLGLTGKAWSPLLASAVSFVLAPFTGVLVTTPAWDVLGVGRPYVPEFFMPMTAFMLRLATTGGLSVA